MALVVALVVVVDRTVVDGTVVPRTPLVVVLTTAAVDVVMEAAVVDVDSEVYW